jgi:hypothetical protein
VPPGDTVQPRTWQNVGHFDIAEVASADVGRGPAGGCRPARPTNLPPLSQAKVRRRTPQGQAAAKEGGRQAWDRTPGCVE